MAALASILGFGLYRHAGVASAFEAFRALPPAQQHTPPMVTLPDHQGISINLADLRGKVVVVRFWATW
jgi:hypothetical protein